MTISYTNRVSRVRLLGFTRLLLLWKASIYKLLYREVIIYVVLYGTISLVYRLALGDAQKRIFAAVVFYFVNFENLIPITFILGFYVTLVAQRWWNQFLNIPWPDRIVPYVANHVSGADERGRMIRRTLIRYLMISETLVFQAISPTVKVRFPTLDHIVEAGIMTKQEKKVFEGLPSQHHKYWVPCQWFANLLTCARQEGRVIDNFGFNKIYEEMLTFKSSLGLLYSYDWVSIPLVYTQVATISVYIFFFTSLISRQFIDSNLVKELTGEVKHEYLIDLYVPGFTLFQLFFYLGWLKVAEQMINPFGEDDDDFDINYILDRNFQVGLMAVDLMYCQVPEVEKDPFWNNLEPQLPHTRASQRYSHEETWMGSMAHIDFPNSSPFLPMDTIPEGQGSGNTSRMAEEQTTGQVFGSNSTFRPPAKKGRLSVFLNNRLDFLKSAPQINSKSLMDLENTSPQYSPLLHTSVPHVKFPFATESPTKPILTRKHDTPQWTRTTRNESFAPPQSIDGNAEAMAENLVQAWIHDEKNAFADKDAQNACLSNSIGNLATSVIIPDVTDGGAVLSDSQMGTELPSPTMELNPNEGPSTSSLCDLRFASNDPMQETGTAFTVEMVQEPAQEKRVVFEVDARNAPSIHDESAPSIVSNNSTVNSTCAIIGKDVVRSCCETPSLPNAHHTDTMDNNSLASSDSGSAESVIDSVRAMSHRQGLCGGQQIHFNQPNLNQPGKSHVLCN